METKIYTMLCIQYVCICMPRQFKLLVQNANRSCIIYVCIIQLDIFTYTCVSYIIIIYFAFSCMIFVIDYIKSIDKIISVVSSYNNKDRLDSSWILIQENITIWHIHCLNKTVFPWDNIYYLMAPSVILNYMASRDVYKISQWI